MENDTTYYFTTCCDLVHLPILSSSSRSDEHSKPRKM